jgi:hypothetical protein
VTALVFVDTETTGLDPDRHEVYEIGLIDGNGAELHLWISDAPLQTADPIALRIGRYYERWPHRPQFEQLPRQLAVTGKSGNPWTAELPSPYVIVACRWPPARGGAVATAHHRGPAPFGPANQGTVGLMPASDWFGWDAWKTGDPDESQRALDAETDRSLDEDPGRWSWGKKVEDTVEEPTRAVPRQGGHGRHGRPGKGRADRTARLVGW